MALTQAQLKAREGKLTGSQMNIVMSGNETKILNLWRELVGDPRYTPDDLSKVWPVRLGEATEALNLEWYALKHGPVTRMGEVVTDGWKAVTLDGWDEKQGIPVECKCVNGRAAMPDIIARYAPQTHWQMIVTKAQQCALSVIIGGAEPIVELIPYDKGYAEKLIEQGRAFLDSVESLTPPVDMPSPAAPPPLPVKEYDMASSNAWGNYATIWLRAWSEAEQFDLACRELKLLVPPDAKTAFGHGITASRNRAGAISIKETK